MRLLPRDVEVGDEAVDEEQVERAVAEHLVGDAEAAAPGVPGLGPHGRSLVRARKDLSPSVPLRM